MKKTILFAAMAALFLITSAFSPAENPYIKANWVRLGAKKVNFKLDRDVMRVGPSKGKFAKLKLVVTAGNLNMHKMIVEYGNGEKDVIQVKHNFRKGSTTRLIDLNGGKRIIKDITFWYDTKNLSGRRATMTVFGRH